MQAEPIAAATQNDQSVPISDPPLTDLSPDLLVDAETPLEGQPEVQNTLETEQQHAAVYSPGVKETPEQTPDQIAAVSGSANAVHSKIPGEDSWLSKHARREKQQDGVAKSDKDGAQSKGASFATVVQYIYLASANDCKASSSPNCISKSEFNHTMRVVQCFHVDVHSG